MRFMAWDRARSLEEAIRIVPGWGRRWLFRANRGQLAELGISGSASVPVNEYEVCRLSFGLPNCLRFLSPHPSHSVALAVEEWIMAEVSLY